MIEKVVIRERVAELKKKASVRHRVTPEQCHIGHLALEAMLEDPDHINQIEVLEDAKECNGSVGTRSAQLASAMRNSGLQVGDHVVLIDFNHLDLCVPYYASHFNGHTLCTIDPSISPSDLKTLFKYLEPKIVFHPSRLTEAVKAALDAHNHSAQLVYFDDPTNDLSAYISKHKGSEIDYHPGVFDESKVMAWLMLTSGTTGIPKVAMIPYSTLLTGLCSWWSYFTNRIHRNIAMGTIQWMSSLHFFIATPLMMYTRLQSSQPMSPQTLVMLINKYKPNATAWTPHMLGRFMEAAGGICDMSSFKYITIGGSSIEKPLYDAFKKKCSNTMLFLVYGMTELLVPVFEYDEKTTPFGSAGHELAKFQYRLVNDAGDVLAADSKESGELWIKGDEFFKGYLNNPEETAKVLTPDEWVKTGDIFYKDSKGYYYFVERKRLLIKYQGQFISPLQLEEVIKQHPGVHDACVVAIPDPQNVELPIGAIVKKDGHQVEAQDIFDLLKKSLPDLKQLHGGLFFLKELPITPSGKVHRAQIRELAFVTPKILPKQV